MTELFNILQLVGGLILSFGYIPQIIKFIRTKSVDDFSVTYLGSICLGVAFMESYAIYMWFVLGTAGAFMITNTIALTLCTTEFALLLKYRKRK
ncbi:hypothetical protein CON39_11565 [Bacillus thuringiensis]|uniref:PQ-loop domain-containing transporter n=1 Tax=Bacillus thuringiensis TaxID=1428 RepID=UPI000BEC2F9D|nr:PQ-loop domain-containing transporter [Bacillus thuringiensis]PEF30304.1 hypothetical protein CON39_11565 [Bacillus thuringiensis]